MKDQHKKISGYRDLLQTEIDLMNEVKAHAAASEKLVAKVYKHVGEQYGASQLKQGDSAETIEKKKAERARLDRTECSQWLAMAKVDLQTGAMKLVRAIAQPTTF